ncbi:MAG: hypothetical protein M1832_004496 [Thelocarpon impressellum]|nr:MAG: hypothetical protein M1832_004496 [Thelocarpon impressellum]
MPLNKRKREIADPLKSDSDDEDYDDRAAPAAGPSRPKPSGSRVRKPVKRKRTEYGSESLESDEDGEEDEESYEEDAVEDEIEFDDRTGRPKRSATKKRITYEESEDDNEPGSDLVAEEDESPKKPKRSQVIKLKVRTPQPTPAPTTRNARTGSVTVTRGRRGPSAEPLSAGTRRSTRLHQDDQDPIVALSDSGRHAEIVGTGTQSPEGRARRNTRGGKGIKAPAGSDIFEEDGGKKAGDRAAEDLGEDAAAASADAEGPPQEAGDPMAKSDTQNATQGDDDDGEGSSQMPIGKDGPAIGGAEPEPEDDDPDDDDVPISRNRRTKGTQPARERLSRRSSQRKTAAQGPSSDVEFRPGDEDEEELSSSEASEASPRKAAGTGGEIDDDSGSGRRSGRVLKGKSRGVSAARPRAGSVSEQNDSERAEELLNELEDLQSGRPKRARRAEIIFNDAPKLRNRKKAVDYRILRPDLLPSEEVEQEQAPTPSRRGRGGGGGGGSWQRTLFSTYGPFGGAGGPAPVFGGPGAVGPAGGVDSDSSDDERAPRAGGFGGAVGMTPTSAAPPGLLPPVQQHNAETGGLSGTPANLGKIKDRKALADADPLGVDQNVSFDSVGGLKDHINQLKEMVSLPLLYPEIFQRFHVTPPRGVLFHGPPGTGKTLLARALAASVSSQGRKITFYMRKGADALSKWVGEAERQLRLLFDEARANQPSIIFFDEIDGLAPVRSSKQEQIHASIVSTLLALMDGMDGRGQVIVIGATNRPDSIDPALRRPGRFDREFYFPLPDIEARRGILDIHTKEWQPGLSSAFKDQLADLTKGYGGADLRALCTEAALNAVQRRYPQIYTSNEKLVIDPTSINITAKDFMISVKKIIPSSQRSTSSGAAPLPKPIEPLLRKPLTEIQDLIKEILPQKKKATALEEAQFEDYDDADDGFQRERLQQEFETSRVFRPRLLIRGSPGMGQQYVAGALLNHFEGLHVQSFDLPTLLSDSTRSLEAAIVQLFAEVRRHKPSVIYIPSVDSWYRTVGPTVISTFLGLLRSLPPTEPVLLLGILESEPDYVDKAMLKSLFGFSRRNQFELERPDKASRKLYFENVANYLRKAPTDFPDPVNRKKRKFEQLQIAPPPPPPTAPTKEQRRAQKLKDHQLLNLLKIRIQPIMDQIKLKYKRFRNGVIEEDQIKYLFDEQEASRTNTDLAPAQLFRPFEKAMDKEGVEGLLEVESQKFYYNLNIVAIEERLSNGFYKRPKDFAADIRRLAKDARVSGDRDRTIKANEMLANVEVDMATIESDPYLADCENVYQRELQRTKEKGERHAKELAAAADAESGSQIAPGLITAGPANSSSEQASTGPVQLGEAVPNAQAPTLLPVTPSRPSQQSSLSNGASADPSSADGPKSQGVGSNGSTVPSRATGDGDVQMTEVDEGADAQHPAPQRSAIERGEASRKSTQPAHSTMSNPSGTANTQRSQKSIITAMPPGSQAEDFINDASTTTSGKKTSDQSNRSSDRWNTQSSNGVNGSGNKEVPDYAGFQSKVHGDSQLPDTQGTWRVQGGPGEAGANAFTEAASSQGSGRQGSQSQAPSHPSSQPPVPAFHAPKRAAPVSSVVALLNSPATEESHPEWIVDGDFIAWLHEEFTERTSGCSIEQLEQINTALMDSVWRQRGEWNRTKTGREVMRVFNGVMQDIEEMQDVLPASLGQEV